MIKMRKVGGVPPFVLLGILYFLISVAWLVNAILNMRSEGRSRASTTNVLLNTIYVSVQIVGLFIIVRRTWRHRRLARDFERVRFRRVADDDGNSTFRIDSDVDTDSDTDSNASEYIAEWLPSEVVTSLTGAPQPQAGAYAMGRGKR